ncbi:MAG: hypothetical protein KC420_16055 [Myxococcales bacterium]|nr:hypothetical protein [Myxococcales bacterium]MCB9570038.1 hypothetical protein [Myxococcales bacterium]MCB9701868.1 hypothetical protein [Myxococcales bacterium]
MRPLARLALSLAATIGLAACSGGDDQGSGATATSITGGATSITTAATTVTTGTTTAATSASSTSGSSGDLSASGSDSESMSGGDKLDLAPDVELPGCDSVDILFVIDNSASMATYQEALAEAFPGFVDAIFANLPKGVDIHVGITTTDFFCNGDGEECACPDSTISCQSAADVATIEMYYTPPTEGSNGINGSQGRLFKHGGQTYFKSNTADDPAPLKNWFTAAAKAAGELGCSFEMPVAAAGYVAHPANAETNAGFIRDEDAVLLVIFLTDEPDKSPEALKTYKQMLLDAKSACGGEACILTAGLVPPCIEGINQKLWQMMTAFGGTPTWGDIKATESYTEVVGEALAAALEDTCTNIPQG